MSICKTCGSYAINHHKHGRDGSDGDLCDVCYWRKRANLATEIERGHLMNLVRKHGHNMTNKEILAIAKEPK